MSTFKENFEAWQASNRARLQERIDEDVFQMQEIDITKTAMAMIEAEIDKDKIKNLLIKYWDLRPSEANRFIQRAEEDMEYFK